MLMILLIVIVLLAFGGGGGYYGYRRWGTGGGIGIFGLGQCFAVFVGVVQHAVYNAHNVPKGISKVRLTKSRRQVILPGFELFNNLLIPYAGKDFHC